MDKEKDYQIVSELTHDEDDGFTEKEAKFVIILLSLVFIIAIVVLIFTKKTGVSGAPAVEETSIEDRLEANRKEYHEILSTADELFSKRVANATCDDVLDIPSLMKSYGFTESGKEWNSSFSSICFDMFNLSLVCTDNKTGETYTLDLNFTEHSPDEVYCKLGIDTAVLNQKQMTALGRALIGEYGSEFVKV